MRIVLVSLFYAGSLGVLFGQAAGDYQSRQDGTWNQTTTWQVFNSGVWNNLEDAGAGAYQGLLPSQNSGVITLRNTVTVSEGTITVDQIEYENDFSGTTGVLSVAAGATLIVNDGTGDDIRLLNDFSTFALLEIHGILQLNNGATIVDDDYDNLGIGSGPVTSLTYKIRNGGTHIHVRGAGASAIPAADWQTGSTCQVDVIPGGTSPAIPDVTFYNFVWNGTGQGTLFDLDAGLVNIDGDLAILSTNGNILRLSGSTSHTLTIGRDLLVQGDSKLQLTTTAASVTVDVGRDLAISSTNTTTNAISFNSTGNLIVNVGRNFTKSDNSPVSLVAGPTGTTTVNVLGDVLLTGGIITRSLSVSSGAASINFNGTGTMSTFANSGSITNMINFTVAAGKTIDFGTSALTGTGAFTNNGTIRLGSTATGGALQLAAAVAGNIRTSGTRTYASGSTIVYNGSAAQYIGAGHPSSASVNTEINNTNGVTLASDITLNGLLTLTSGNLSIASHTLTLAGVYVPNGNALGVTSSSNLVVNGSGAFGTLTFSGTTLNNFTLNRSSNTITLGSDLTVGEAFALSAGDLTLNGKALTLQGDFNVTSGTMTSDNAASLIISGAGTLPPSVSIGGGVINTLTLNRASATLSISTSSLTITNLNLTNGTFSNGATNITMATGGTITRSEGSISNAPGAASSYNVLYTTASNISTGPELPLDPNTTRLANLTTQGAGTVTLSGATTVNETLTLSAGTLSAGANYQVAIGGNFIVNGGTFQAQSGAVLFNGSTSQSISRTAGTGTVSLYDLVVNKTSSTVEIQTNVDIQNSLSVNSVTTVNAGINLLRLLSTSTLTARVNELNSGAVINGTVIVQRFLPNSASLRAYRYIASPVTNAFVSDWQSEMAITGPFSNPSTGSGLVSKNASMFYYDETYTTAGTTLASRYRNYPASGSSNITPLINGTGYALFVRSTGAITFDTRGTLAQGQVSVNVTAQSAGGDDGWNLIGNPYPAPIDWNNVTIPAGVNNAIYMTDNTNNSGEGVASIVSYVDGVGVPATYAGLISQGQAFWVRATTNGTIAFEEDDKSISAPQFFREQTTPEILRISLTSQQYADEIVLRLRDNATDLFDSRYDAYKLKNPYLNLSSVIGDGNKLTINSLSHLDCDKQIPLAIEDAKTGSHQFNFTGIETFGPETNLYFVDTLENVTINIRQSAHYSFQITNDNINALPHRFKIVIKNTAPDVGLSAFGESVCVGQTTAIISISNTQTYVQYALAQNGQQLSEYTIGNGATLTLPVAVNTLKEGKNNLTVLAKISSCTILPLAEMPLVTVVSKEQITHAEGGKLCRSGSIALVASGVSEAGWYNWYEDIGDSTPISGQQGNKFVTPVLAKTKTYYVAGVNSHGCEDERIAVKAEIVNFDDVTIEAQGSTLISSYNSDNQWYLNGKIIEGAISKQIEALQPGIYTVKVGNGGCTTSASREMAVTSLEDYEHSEIDVYPNPTTGKFIVSVDSKRSVKVLLFSSVGKEIGSSTLNSNNNSVEFLLDSYPSGIYILKIVDDERTFIQKISKVN